MWRKLQESRGTWRAGLAGVSTSSKSDTAQAHARACSDMRMEVWDIRPPQHAFRLGFFARIKSVRVSAGTEKHNSCLLNVMQDGEPRTRVGILHSETRDADPLPPAQACTPSYL